MKDLLVLLIGIVLLVSSSLWASLEFFSGERDSASADLESNETLELVSNLKGEGLGFYKVEVADYNRNLLASSVFDLDGKAIYQKAISARISVNYFKFDKDGPYVIKITNFQTKPVSIKVEFGDSKSSLQSPPPYMIVVGLALIIVYAYRRLKNYATAQSAK